MGAGFAFSSYVACGVLDSEKDGKVWMGADVNESGALWMGTKRVNRIEKGSPIL
jgi:hypothetical protein